MLILIGRIHFQPGQQRLVLFVICCNLWEGVCVADEQKFTICRKDDKQENGAKQELSQVTVQCCKSLPFQLRIKCAVKDLSGILYVTSKVTPSPLSYKL